MTVDQALDVLVDECPFGIAREAHQAGKQRHLVFGDSPVRCHSESFFKALPDAGWRRSDAQRVYEDIMNREMKP